MPLIHKLIRRAMNPRVQKLLKPLKKKDLVKDWNVFRGDQVCVMKGKDKGKIGTVVEVLRERNIIKVENLNLAKKKVMKTESTPSGYIMKEMPIHVNDVSLLDPSTNLPTKVKVLPYFNDETGKNEKRRYSISTGTFIPRPKPLDPKETSVDGPCDTSAEDVQEVTYKPMKNMAPLPTEILLELYNKNKSII
ncbi:hypothetical protein BB560_007215 [Smittium megazygosporum]|uniref:KOW domain-containing protein n=1 Tax=Smittium megazygosporum TaxID=133381 RepID=A0A2T9XXY5_9FUNG|nr:hypothetical protein BB560_007215 [Smittium megazygosporum]